MIRGQHSAWLNKGQTRLCTMTQGRDKILTSFQKVKSSICLVLLENWIMVRIINNKTWEGSELKKEVKCLGEQWFEMQLCGSQGRGTSTACLAVKGTTTIPCKGLPNSLVIPQAQPETGWIL